MHSTVPFKRSLLAALTVLACSAMLPSEARQAAAQAPAADAKKPLPTISFFVTSTSLGKGADLGGLDGADRHCQNLAGAVGSSKSWRAYLSTQASEGKPAVNARDRIGQGPWHNARGAVVARDLAHLHGDTHELARLGSNLSKNTAFTEKNEPVKGAGDTPNQHDILTGSQIDGRAFTDSADHTCKNFTSSAPDGSAQVGHFDRTGGGNTSWNSTHGSRGCGQDKLESSGGAGLLYCFAVN